MFYHEDWLIRQIEMMIQAILNKICKKESGSSFEEKSKIQQTILDLLSNDKICEAENLIFEFADEKRNDYNYLLTVLDFYKNLNGMSEDYLNKHNFSHQEIREGVLNFCSYYDSDEIKKILNTFELERLVKGDDDI